MVKIATILNVHTDPDLVKDTLCSISTYMTNDVVVVVDGSKWDDFEDVEIAANKVSGFRHDCNKSPYRNVALGLKTVTEIYPDAEWYCYVESDVLITSSRFKDNLKMADDKNVWMLGNDGRIDDKQMPLVESLVGEKFKSIYYLIGCCHFFSSNFINKLKEINFFERFLHLTNEFSPGYFPNYNGYDISEHMYATLCRHFGGNIGVFATYDYKKLKWHGSSEYFPIRWMPDIDLNEVDLDKASIIHPIKKFNDPIREHYRKIRK